MRADVCFLATPWPGVKLASVPPDLAVEVVSRSAGDRQDREYRQWNSGWVDPELLVISPDDEPPCARDAS